MLIYFLLTEYMLLLLFKRNALDKLPVPEDTPGPSDHHKQLYQQYRDNMRQAYKSVAKQVKVSDVCDAFVAQIFNYAIFFTIIMQICCCI